MALRSAALALPASAAAVLLAVKGPGVLAGPTSGSFVVLAVTGAAGILACIVGERMAARGRAPSLPVQLETLLGAAAGAIGDATLAFDVQGRLVWANDAAAHLTGEPAGALAGRSHRVLGDDVATLLRGLAGGPASGRVTLLSRAGAVRADAAAVRVPGRPPFDVLVLRVDSAGDEGPSLIEDSDVVDEPPPLRPALVRHRTAGGHATGEASIVPAPLAWAYGAPLARVAVQLRGALSRATASAALLRLTLPGGLGAAAQHLDNVERELRATEDMIDAVTTPLPPGSPHVIDVDVVASDALARAGIGAGVHVTRTGGSVHAVADAQQLRKALCHALRLAVQAMPSGGTLTLRTAEIAGRAVIEITDTGAELEDGSSTVDLPLAERLVAAQRGHLERTRIPGRGSLCRILLPAAARGCATAEGSVSPARAAS